MSKLKNYRYYVSLLLVLVFVSVVFNDKEVIKKIILSVPTGLYAQASSLLIIIFSTLFVFDSIKDVVAMKNYIIIRKKNVYKKKIIWNVLITNFILIVTLFVYALFLGYFNYVYFVLYYIIVNSYLIGILCVIEERQLTMFFISVLMIQILVRSISLL